MRSVYIAVCLIAGSLSLAWGEDLPLVAETCVEEKLRIQELVQQNAQLQVSNAQLVFDKAQLEKTRLEAVKKAAPQNGGTATPVKP
jgi:hypothetical protein